VHFASGGISFSERKVCHALSTRDQGLLQNI